MLECARLIDATPIVVVREEDAASALASGEAFSPEERAAAAAFLIEKRRREWSLGRLAAKAAIQRVLERRGEVLPEASLAIEHGPGGEPLATLVREGARTPLGLGLSLSHGHGLGAAWADEAGSPGVDVELIRERPEGTFRFYLDESERAPVLALSGSARDAAAVILWSVKEAAWKTLRPGRGVGLIDFEVRVADLTQRSGRASVAPRGPAVALARERGVREIEASFLREGDIVFAWALAGP